MTAAPIPERFVVQAKEEWQYCAGSPYNPIGHTCGVNPCRLHFTFARALFDADRAAEARGIVYVLNTVTLFLRNRRGAKVTPEIKAELLILADGFERELGHYRALLAPPSSDGAGEDK